MLHRILRQTNKQTKQTNKNKTKQERKQEQNLNWNAANSSYSFTLLSKGGQKLLPKSTEIGQTFNCRHN